MTPPLWPAGELVSEPNPSVERRAAMIAELAAFPAKLVSAISGLGEKQLELKYSKWTIRQIVHHITDSHVNCFVRLRLRNDLIVLK